MSGSTGAVAAISAIERSEGVWHAAARRFRRDRVGVVSLLLVLGFVLLIMASALRLVASGWQQEIGVPNARPTFMGPAPAAQQAAVDTARTNEDSHNVSVIDPATNSVITTIPLAADADPRDVDISADGVYAYVTSGQIAGNDVVYVIDVATLQLLPSIDIFPASDPNVIAVAPPFASLDPIASFTSNSPVPIGTPIQFTDTTLNNPTSWTWDFGDGLGNSTTQNPAYNYANPGTYTVTLTTTNLCGQDTFVDTVTVGITPPNLYLPLLFRQINTARP